MEVCSQEAAGLSDGTETFWPEEEHSFDISCKGHEQLKSFSFSYKDSNLHWSVKGIWKTLEKKELVA